jgi:hypothetical protein
LGGLNRNSHGGKEILVAGFVSVGGFGKTMEERQEKGFGRLFLSPLARVKRNRHGGKA